MTRQEILVLFRGLNSLGNLTGVNFSYAVMRNMNRLKPEIEALEKSLEPTEEYKKYDEERVELCKEQARKDEDGKPITVRDVNGQEKYDVDEITFAPLLEALKEKYKDVVEARIAQEKEYNELLKTETDVDLFKVKIENVPEAISTVQMYAISPIIEE